MRYLMKPVFFLLFMVLMGPSLQLAQGQTSPKPESLKPSTLEQLIYRALKPSLRLVRQEFIMVNDAGKKYGYNQKPYFSRVYQVGVLAAGKLWVGLQYAQQPWLTDGRYIENKNIGNPLLTVRTWRPLDEGSFDQVHTTWNVEGQRLGSLALPDANLNAKLIEQSTQSSPSEGWLVVVVYAEGRIDPDQEDKKLVLRYRCLHMNKEELKFTTNNASGELPILSKLLPPNSTILGGGCYTVQVESPGTVKFQVAAVLAQQQSSGWRLFLLPNDKSLDPFRSLDPEKLLRTKDSLANGSSDPPGQVPPRPGGSDDKDKSAKSGDQSKPKIDQVGQSAPSAKRDSVQVAPEVGIKDKQPAQNTTKNKQKLDKLAVEAQKRAKKEAQKQKQVEEAERKKAEKAAKRDKPSDPSETPKNQY